MTGRRDHRDRIALPMGGVETADVTDSGDAFSYSDSDLSQFSHLGRFSNSRSSASDDPGMGVVTAMGDQSDGAFDYTENDKRAFDHLMSALNSGPTPNVKQSSRSVKAGASRSGYSQRDDQAFASLMPAIDSGRSPEAERDSRSVRGAPDTSAFSYSESDLNKFDSLTPGGGSGSRSAAKGREARAKKPDRDVGQIRIVDFDKRSAETGRPDRRENNGITVKFFD